MMRKDTQGHSGVEAPPAQVSYYQRALDRATAQRKEREALLAEQAGWGRLNAEMEGTPYGRSRSTFDPVDFERSHYSSVDWGATAGSDWRYMAMNQGPPAQPPPQKHHWIPMALDLYDLGPSFGGAGGWGRGE